MEVINLVKVFIFPNISKFNTNNIFDYHLLDLISIANEQTKTKENIVDYLIRILAKKSVS
jgi:hypothetical protein